MIRFDKKFSLTGAFTEDTKEKKSNLTGCDTHQNLKLAIMCPHSVMLFVEMMKCCIYIVVIGLFSVIVIQ